MPGYRRSRALWDETRRPNAPKMALVRAILYELQPIHFRRIDTTQWRARWHSLIRGGSKFGKETLPSTTHSAYKFLLNLSLRSWMMVAGVLLYYVAVRTIHEYVCNYATTMLDCAFIF